MQAAMLPSQIKLLAAGHSERPTVHMIQRHALCVSLHHSCVRLVRRGLAITRTGWAAHRCGHRSRSARNR
eukprot:scaffold2140_cov140-Isochrysis_galbana.AAC.1